jgi:hypothetical protein
MPNPIINYPLDISGINPTNKVNNEIHVITPLRRAVAMNYGPFFEQGLVVRNSITNAILTPVVDYSIGLIYPAATMATKKAVYCFIVVNNLSITSISVSYQVLGGEYSQYTGALQEILNTLALDERPVEWGSLIGLPEGFAPVPHQHPAYSIHSWGAMISALDRLKSAILVGNQQAVNELYAYVNTVFGSSNAPIATIAEANEGVSNAMRITPFNLKGVLDIRFAEANIPDFEYELDPIDDDWGFFRHKNSGFTICWGTTSAIGSGEAFRAFFRKRFDFRPSVVGSPLNVTSDANPSGAQWVELTANIVDHTLTFESFHVAANRLNGTGNDKVRFKYVAIGTASDNNPLAVSNGNIAVVPPAGATLTQPVWSGTNSIAIKTTETGTHRMGIAFTSNVPGGGYVFNTTAQTPLSNIYYTSYPGLFVDNDYEVSVTVANTQFNPQLTSVGLALNTWHDLAVIRALDPLLPANTFAFETSGLFGGVLTLNVTIRKKSDTLITSSRTFTLDRDSTARRLRWTNNPIGGTITERPSYNAPTATNRDTSIAMQLSSGNYRVRALRFDGQQLTNEILRLVSDDGLTSSDLIAADLDLYEVRGLFTGINTWTLAPTSLAVVPENTTSSSGGWVNLSAYLSSSNGFSVRNASNVSTGREITLQIRHKTDWRKAVTAIFDIRQAGADIIPVWSGNFGVNASAASGALVTYEIVASTSIATGLLIIRWSVNGVYDERQVSWSSGLSNVSGSNYSSSIDGTITNTGSVLTAGSLLGATGTMVANRSLTWQGTVNQQTVITVPFKIAHVSYGTAAATQVFTFTVNVS